MAAHDTFKIDRLWFWAALTAAARLALIAAACLAARLGLGDLALLHDGWEYLRLAAALTGHEASPLAPESLRLYPGFPLAMAALGAGQPHLFATAGLALAIACASVAGMMTARLGGDERLAAAMIALTPSWIVFTSTVMSEGLAAALALGALLLIRDGRWAAASALAGAAYLVRPVGILLLAPLMVEGLARRDGRRAMAGAGVALGIVGVHLAVSRAIGGEALQAARAYAVKDFDWPLRTLALGLMNPRADLLRWGLVSGMLALSAAGGWGLWRGWRAGRTEWRALLAWHAAAGAFYVLLPSTWTFACMDRFLLAIWPTTLIGLMAWAGRLPKFLFWLGLGAASVGSFMVGWLWLVKLAEVFPFAERAFGY